MLFMMIMMFYHFKKTWYSYNLSINRFKNF